MIDSTSSIRPAPALPTRRRRLFAVLPSLLTLGNAVCGFGAITYAAKVGPERGSPNDLYMAALLIFMAMVFDALDGPVARLSKQTSDFGAQLDSLCDAISFGAAPAFLMLRFSDWGEFFVSIGAIPILARIQWVIAVLYLLCAVLRLARFNVLKAASSDPNFFVGLPSPAAAGTVASLVVVGPALQRWTRADTTEWSQRIGQFLIEAIEVSLPLVTLAVAVLMVSRVRYPHLFNQLFSGRRSFWYLVKLIFALVVAFAVHELAVPLILCYYALGAPIQSAVQRLFGVRPVEAPQR